MHSDSSHLDISINAQYYLSRLVVLSCAELKRESGANPELTRSGKREQRLSQHCTKFIHVWEVKPEAMSKSAFTHHALESEDLPVTEE
ncbi:hypothetical protein VA7868_04557 [Vibrio aerogenes CECT 7868]|uniref:Uncharacterized protein n=1 Tax=Vibrio aerogenes CECT 7868 TaxID=1216006 RepID=A0A1M6EZZ3_9VIBR|nr:hypothetical protein VA7868_04557 [Vibrio aerogenes CECT 7868]